MATFIRKYLNESEHFLKPLGIISFYWMFLVKFSPAFPFSISDAVALKFFKMQHDWNDIQANRRQNCKTQYYIMLFSCFTCTTNID